MPWLKKSRPRSHLTRHFQVSRICRSVSLLSKLRKPLDIPGGTTKPLRSYISCLQRCRSTPFLMCMRTFGYEKPQYTLVAIGVIAVSYAGIYFVGPYFITILEQLITPQDVFSQLVRGPTDAVVEKITASLTSYASLPGVTDLSIGLFVEQIAKALRYSWGDDQAAQILYIVLTKMPINTVSDVYAH